MIARAAGDPAALAGRLEREINALAPDMPIDLRTMRQALVGIFGFLIFRMGALQTGGMGLLGLILAMVSVYGVVSLGASMRTREIGSVTCRTARAGKCTSAGASWRWESC